MPGRPLLLAVRAPHEKHRSKIFNLQIWKLAVHIKFRIDGAFRIDRLFNSRISAQNLRLLLIDQLQLACIVYRNRPSRVKRRDLGPFKTPGTSERAANLAELTRDAAVRAHRAGGAAGGSAAPGAGARRALDVRFRCPRRSRPTRLR